MKKNQSTPQDIYTVKKYQATNKNAWDAFVDACKNATFLFNRDFMDYHSDRFQDFSLLVYKGEKLVALLPGNVSGNVVYSHQGLSYGGLLFQKELKFKEVLLIFRSIFSFLSLEGIKTLQLKILPKIYVQNPNDAVEYLLFALGAKNIRTDIASVISLKNSIKIASNRIEGVKKAQKLGLKIIENKDFSPFWNTILIPNLENRHNAAPVHSLSEITELATSFPKNIHQFSVYNDAKIVAGATIFETETVAHVQYISADNDKQVLGSLDFLFNFLITERFKDKMYFDFGISNENNGKNINEGLLYWKECFGARSIMHNFYEVETATFTNLDTVFI